MQFRDGCLEKFWAFDPFGIEWSV